MRATEADSGVSARATADTTSVPLMGPETRHGGASRRCGTMHSRPRGPTMPQSYRVRYSLKPSGQHHGGADVVTADVEGDLEAIPARLPAGAYIMYVEDLTG